METPRRAGLLVVGRIIYFDGTSRVPMPQRRPTIPLSHDEILSRYRGFEGEPWPEGVGSRSLVLTAGLASLDQYDRVMTLYEGISNKGLAEVLYVIFPDGLSENVSAPEGFSFHGYDYGFFHSEFSHYSVVFNEIIYGTIGELCNYATLLNGNLLIPSHGMVQEVQEVRTQLLEKGADVEDAESCEPIAIYARDNGHFGERAVSN